MKQTDEEKRRLVRADRRRNRVALLAEGLVDDRAVVDLDGAGGRVDPGEGVLAPVLLDGLLLLALQGLAVVLWGRKSG